MIRVVLADDHGTAAQDGEHRRHGGRDRGFLRGGDERLLAVADGPGEHGATGDDGSHERGEEGLRRRIHT